MSSKKTNGGTHTIIQQNSEIDAAKFDDIDEMTDANPADLTSGVYEFLTEFSEGISYE